MIFWNDELVLDLSFHLVRSPLGVYGHTNISVFGLGSIEPSIHTSLELDVTKQILMFVLSHESFLILANREVLQSVHLFKGSVRWLDEKCTYQIQNWTCLFRASKV
jgi:hypothetical protein